jgi:hypothetical protein
MKALLKYITLLLVGGVIIPFYFHTIGITQRPTNTVTPLAAIRVSLSVMETVVSKLFPFIKYFG